MKRHVHYEVAFEDYLRSRGVPYVAVDEARKAVFVGTEVKSFDFLVYPPGEVKWIVDVKGRKFGGKASRRWKCWVGRADVEGMTEWEKVFGAGYRALFAFAYWLAEPTPTPLFDSMHHHGGRDYAFLAVWLDDYKAGMKLLNESWDTVNLPSDYFKKVFVPFDRLLDARP